MKNAIFKTLVVAFLLNFGACAENKGNKAEVNQEKQDMNRMFIGTYTKPEGHVNGQADGIYVVYQDPKSGNLEKGKTVAEVINPSFVKASKDGEFLFAVSELGSGDAESGFIYSFKINDDNTLQELSKLSTESFAPAHIEIDKTGNYVFVSNYMGGVVMVYKKNEDGALEKVQRVDLENPTESHAHSVTISTDNKHAYIADLGNDKIWNFDFDPESGKLTPAPQPSVDLENGAGPRHFTLSKRGNFAYSMNELNSTVTVFKVLPNGGLEKVQTISSLPEDFSGENSAADIHLHPSGEFLYASNRGHNSIAAYKVDEETGTLSNLSFTSTKGKTPRNFAISPNGDFLYVANQDSNNIAVFEIDEKSGNIQIQGKPLEAMTPVSIEFVE